MFHVYEKVFHIAEQTDEVQSVKTGKKEGYGDI
jgi:hypothetical protein